MKFHKTFTTGFLIILVLSSHAFPEDFSLTYFLNKTNSKTESLSQKEKIEFLNQIEKLLVRTEAVHERIVHQIKTGALEILYQEGDFWLSKMKEDEKSIQTGREQIQSLKKRPSSLLASTILFKSLKDLSANFNTYNNVPSFSGMVGDLAPELGLWADPVFYQLYLLPLVRVKDVERTTPQKEKTPPSKTKIPS